jgi:hypothetical protein
MARARRAVLGLALVAGVLAAGATPAAAQVELLPPDLLAKLVAANERPLTLGPDGEAQRFRTGEEHWEEAMPPSIVDVDHDGTKDYIVQLLVDSESGRRALLARAWGQAADAFGPTVFYVIIEDNEDIAEWAGSPRLAVPPRPAP